MAQISESDPEYFLATPTQAAARLLLVDDDAEMRALLRSMLRPLDVDIVEAASGPQFTAALDQQGPFDLIITDVRMPAPTGLQVVENARKAGLQTPVIIVTAFPDDVLVESIAALGGTITMAKPLDRKDLLAAVRLLIALDREHPATLQAGPGRSER